MVEELRTRLLRQAYLFDDPAGYEAGVRDTLDALRDLDLLDDDPDATIEVAVSG